MKLQVIQTIVIYSLLRHAVYEATKSNVRYITIYKAVSFLIQFLFYDDQTYTQSP